MYSILREILVLYWSVSFWILQNKTNIFVILLKIPILCFFLFFKKCGCGLNDIQILLCVYLLSLKIQLSFLRIWRSFYFLDILRHHIIKTLYNLCTLMLSQFSDLPHKTYFKIIFNAYDFPEYQSHKWSFLIVTFIFIIPTGRIFLLESAWAN